jgi:hypothetical protein
MPVAIGVRWPKTFSIVSVFDPVAVAVNQRPNLSGFLEFNKKKGARAKKHTETKGDGRRCISLFFIE